jgi:3-deoxy-manno-octulosonate cytidylyltransferase (CMP-KDO synthetase)
MTYTVLIPARLASTRLPNKPLLLINGKPMVVQVAHRVASGFATGMAPKIVVAADDESIVRACQAHGVKAVLTRTDHASGSDRLAEACEILGLSADDIVVNVQGDEPLINPALVGVVAQCLQAHPRAAMSTAAHPIALASELLNPNVVKVVLGAAGQALYFSRAPIPWQRDLFPALERGSLPNEWPTLAPGTSYRHIGIYGYRVHFLSQFPRLQAAPLEQLEALEQLRALWHGYTIQVHVCDDAPEAGVDTPEDLVRVRAHFAQRPLE